MLTHPKPQCCSNDPLSSLIQASRTSPRKPLPPLCQIENSFSKITHFFHSACSHEKQTTPSKTLSPPLHNHDKTRGFIHVSRRMRRLLTHVATRRSYSPLRHRGSKGPIAREKHPPEPSRVGNSFPSPECSPCGKTATSSDPSKEIPPQWLVLKGCISPCKNKKKPVAPPVLCPQCMFGAWTVNSPVQTKGVHCPKFDRTESALNLLWKRHNFDHCGLALSPAKCLSSE
jgi:hypothetical protein